MSRCESVRKAGLISEDANRNIGGLWNWSALDKETSRLEAFSDGVFAIAITLLILEIRVPELQSETNGNLLSSLGRLWPSFSAFVLSFFVVLLIWINHHELFRMVQRVDRLLMFANGALLLMVTFIPFPTAMLARYFGTPAANTAVAFYCATFLVASVCHNLLFESVARDRRLLRADISNREIARIRRSYHLGLAVYSLSVLVAIFSAIGGLVISGALWILWATLRYGSARGQA
jgi:uncharacterized membrane protein